MQYTIGDVAEMAGISVRALHHYDAIGLLAPTTTGENGYRYYDRDALYRLQQILIHRALGMSLAEIGAILDDPGFDRLAALTLQRDRVASELERHAEMLRTIDRTIAALTETDAMTEAELYAGIIDPRKQAEYEAWLVEAYGPEITEYIAVSRRKMDTLSEAGRAAMMEELRQIENGLAEALRRGLPPQATALDPLLAAHWGWVLSTWNQDAPVSAYAGLADTYLAHPDFVQRYESIAPGFADFLATAMKAWAARQETGGNQNGPS